MDTLNEIIGYVTAAVTAASIITAATPTPKDDVWFSKIYKIIEVLGLVTGKAKQK